MSDLPYRYPISISHIGSYLVTLDWCRALRRDGDREVGRERALGRGDTAAQSAGEYELMGSNYLPIPMEGFFPILQALQVFGLKG